MSEKELQIPHDNFEDAERFQRLFVQPMVEAVRGEMKTHVDRVTQIVTDATKKVEGHEARLTTLEGNQKKALLGWGVLVTIVTSAIAFAGDRLKRWLHIG